MHAKVLVCRNSLIQPLHQPLLDWLVQRVHAHKNCSMPGFQARIIIWCFQKGMLALQAMSASHLRLDCISVSTPSKRQLLLMHHDGDNCCGEQFTHIAVKIACILRSRLPRAPPEKILPSNIQHSRVVDSLQLLLVT